MTMGLVHADGYHARVCGGSLRHVHLAVGHDPSTQMTVSFSSIRSSQAVYHRVGAVMVGTHPDQLDLYFEEQEPPRAYNATPVQEKHGHYYSPYQHHVQLQGLEPDTQYYYKCVILKPQDQHEQHEQQPHAGASRPPQRKDDKSLRGNPNINFEEEVLRAQEREEVTVDVDDDGVSTLDEDEGAPHDEDDNGSRRLAQRERRFLNLVYYDSTRAECPPPHKIRRFQTAPPIGSIGKKKNQQEGQEDGQQQQPPSLKFAYLGDLGQFTHSIENLKHLVTHQRSEISAIMLAGDIAYTGYDNRRWDTYFDFMDDFFMIDEIPMQICAGNHDIDKQENDSDIFLAYENRFRMPQVKPAELGTYQGPTGYLDMDAPDYPLPYEYGNSYYAFPYGVTHNIFLNAYASMEPTSSQYQWLVHELEAVDRSVTPWLIVTMHVPVYNGFDVHHHDLQIVAAKQHLEPLFVQYNVNLVVAGHIHAYQRTNNVALDILDPKGPVHVVVGAGGRQCKAQFRTEEPDPWMAVRDATRYGYGTLEIFNQTHAKWDWIITGESGKFRKWLALTCMFCTFCWQDHFESRLMSLFSLQFPSAISLMF